MIKYISHKGQSAEPDLYLVLSHNDRKESGRHLVQATTGNENSICSSSSKAVVMVDYKNKPSARNVVVSI